MNWRKHKLLIVSGIFFALLLIGALYLLFFFRNGYVEQKRELQSNVGQLTNLNNRNPFPSRENLDVLKSDAESLQTFHKDLIKKLSSGQVAPLKIESAQFPTLLNRTAIKIRQNASDRNVLIPENFLFGFNQYADGSLPAPGNVERLTLQLQMAEKLLDVLYESGVKSVVDVERQEFENEKEIDSAPGRDVGRGSSRSRSREPIKTPESDQYTKEAFTLKFTAGDPALWKVLNQLAAHPMFIVTTDVKFLNMAVPDASLAPMFKGADSSRTRSSTRTPPGGVRRAPGAAMNPFAVNMPATDPVVTEQTAKDKPTGPVASHEERIVAGRELIDATLTVEIYRVKRPEENDSEMGADNE